MMTTPEPPTMEIRSAPRLVLAVEPDGRIHGPAVTRLLIKVLALSAAMGGVVGGIGGALVRLL